MVDNMDLIRKLQETPLWQGFEVWYIENFHFHGGIPLNGWYCGGDPKPGFAELPFEFQKGVFEKFIERDGFEIEYYGCYNLLKKNTFVTINDELPDWETFKELLIWYFTHENR